MPMKVEAAVVTCKQSDAAFNTDSININGKTFPEEVIKNGYKGSGVVSGNVHFALASSKIEGFAGATVRAFDERAKKFPVTREPKNVFSGFFEDCRSALLNMKKQEDELVCACLYASGRTITVAGNGDTGLYALRFGACSQIVSEKAENTVADYNLAVISDVSENDIYILLSLGAANALSAKDIEDICKVSDGSVKRIVNLISKVALGNGADGAVTVIAVKVLETAAEDELSVAGFVPDFAAMEKMLYGDESVNDEAETAETDANAAVVQEDNEEAQTVFSKEPDEYVENESFSEKTETDTVETAEEADNAEENDSEEVIDDDEARGIYTENTEDAENSEETAEDNTETEAVNGKSDKKTRIMLFSILGVMFAVSVVLIGLIAVELFGDKIPQTDTTVNATEETSEEETTKEETTEESTTEEQASEEEAATNNEEETTRKPAVSTPVASVTTRPQQTTQSPAAQTTRAPETTAAPAEETTTEQTSSEQTTAQQTTENTPEEATTAAEPSSSEEPASEAAEEAQNTEESAEA